MKKKFSKKGITLDDLAMMTQRGFEESNYNLKNFREETNQRLDRIENKLIAQHTKEIEHLRDKVMQHEVKFAKLLK